MSGVESPRARAGDVSPSEVLQARLYPGTRVQSAALLTLAVAGQVLLFAVGLKAEVAGIVLLSMLLIPVPGIEVLIALRHRHLWSAQEVMSWIAWEAAEDWRDSGGGMYPSNRRQIEVWLNGHSDDGRSAARRARVLILAGRPAEARRVVANLPVETPRQRQIRANLQFAADALEGVPLDAAAASPAAAAGPSAAVAGSDLSRASVAAHVAYRAALADVAAGGGGLDRLTEARQFLGAFPPALLRRLWLDRMRYAVSSAVGGLWLWVGLFVALGSSGGVVWF